MAEPTERVEGREILDEYKDGEMEVSRDDRSDDGQDGDAESGGGGETGSEQETGGVRERDTIGRGRGACDQPGPRGGGGYEIETGRVRGGRSGEGYAGGCRGQGGSYGGGRGAGGGRGGGGGSRGRGWRRNRRHYRPYQIASCLQEP